MNIKATLLILVLFPASLFAQSEQDRLDRIYEATARVSVSGGVGTGTVYREDETFYYLVTNAHVVGNARTVGLEFTKNHYPSPRFSAEVTKRRLASGIDVAEIRIRKVDLKGVVLPIIPLATADDDPRELFLVTSGCQAGERPSVQLTLTVRETTGLVYYLPTARPGRSGSALVNQEGTKIYGLVAWMTNQGRNSQGLAMTADVIRPFLMGTSEPFAASEDFPDNAIPIPLASDQDVGAQVSALQSITREECLPNACVDEKSPWEYEILNQDGKNPWIDRFGGERVKPQQPAPQQPSPQAPQGPSDPWKGETQPKPEPKPEVKPEPKDRPRLFDGEREFFKLFDRFDKLEPKVDRLFDRFDPIEKGLDDLKEDEEEVARRRRLFDRLERIPDKLIGPDDLNKFADRQSDGIFERFRSGVQQMMSNFINAPLMQPFIWGARLIVWGLALWGINLVMTPLFGPAWLGWLIAKFFSTIRWVIDNVRSGISSAMNKAKPEPIAVKQPRKPRAKKTA